MASNQPLIEQNKSSNTRGGNVSSGAIKNAITSLTPNNNAADANKSKNIIDDNYWLFLGKPNNKQKPGNQFIPSLPFILGDLYKSDILENRFQINTNEPLSQYDGYFSKAFSVTDLENPRRPLYAAITPGAIPARLDAIKILARNRHMNISSLVSYGACYLPNLAGCHLVSIWQRPKGKTLKQILQARNEPFGEKFIINEILRPLQSVINFLGNHNITHGRINLDTIYYHPKTVEKLTLIEGFSEPTSAAQHDLFSPIEYSLAQPIAKGNGENSMDCYAMAMLTHFLQHGNLSLLDWDKESITEMRLNDGTHFLLDRYDTSITFQDFLRSCLSDKKHERWKNWQVDKWLDGQSFNVLRPRPPREGPRPFEFGGKELLNRRSIAWALSKNWRKAYYIIKDNVLSKWLDLSGQKSDITNKLRRVTSYASTNSSVKKSNDAIESEIVAKAITLIDQTGPIRYRDFSTHIDGVGALIAYAFAEQNHKDIDTIKNLILADLDEFWLEQYDDNQQNEYLKSLESTSFKLHNLRVMVSSNRLGFGMERALYDLNIDMNCRSPLIAKYNITNVEQLLKYLDMIAPNVKEQYEPVDRHIAAFICSHLEIISEIRLPELQRFDNINNDKYIGILSLLAKAQRNSGLDKLNNLCDWMMIYLEKTMQHINNREYRAKLTADLYRISKTGSLSHIEETLVNSPFLLKNQLGFAKARETYQKQTARIAELNDLNRITKEATEAGLKIAFYLAGAIFCVILSYYIAELI